MAKLAAHLLTLALVLFLANASITTVTVNSEENPWGRGRREEGGCQEQIEKQDNLWHCQKYMESRSSKSDSDVSDKHLDACCEQLEELDRECICPGLKQAMQQQMQGGQWGREEMRELHQVSEKILSKCEVEPRRCETRTNPRKQQESSCEQQIKEQNNLRHCQRYIEEQCRRSSDYIRRSRHLDSCCEQLEELDKQCRCPGVNRVVQQRLQGGQLGREEKREMYQVAEKIMSECEMEPRRCGMSPRCWL